MCCLPLPVAQEPYKAAIGHDKSALQQIYVLRELRPCSFPFWTTGSFVELVECVHFTSRRKRELCTAGLALQIPQLLHKPYPCAFCGFQENKAIVSLYSTD
jgi:hypothetical protein